MHDVIAFDAPGCLRRPRRVLLLQGLAGPFFRRIGIALRRQGVKVQKINFNGGDKFFWGFSGGGIDYTGTEAAWPIFLERTILEHDITDVFLFGDCRPIHRAAVLVCLKLSVTIDVFDEGYIRPDWVTFERGGVNGYSQLPRDPTYFLEQAKSLTSPPPHAPIPFSFRRRSCEAILYDAANILLLWRFPHWRNHRPWNPLHEGFGWLRRLMGRRAAMTRSAATLAKLVEAGASYMLFPLQLESDAQIRFHSPYESMKVALEQILKSFAMHAPLPLRLLVKEHPLDNGLSDWRKLVMELAEAHGIAGRVDYVEHGDIALIVRSAKGLVTVNSTTGTLALANNVPVITLGYAIYDMLGITHQEGLEAFWKAPNGPDAETFEAFRRVLIDRCLVPGGFFSERALQLSVDGVVNRLMVSHAAEFPFANIDSVVSNGYMMDVQPLAGIA